MVSIFAVLKPNAVITDVEEIFLTVAQGRGHEAYVFTAKDVDFDQKKISGKTLRHGEIVIEQFDFPDVIQNRLAVKAEDKETYLKLAEIIPFTSNRVGTKKQVDSKLRTIEELQEFMIEVEHCESVEQIKSALQKHGKIILKPLSGNQGKGIFTLELNENNIIIKQLDHCLEIELNQLQDFYTQNFKNKGYAISPFFKSMTENNLNTVFRLQINRGENGKWQLIKFFPYINVNAELDITNGMQGALITLREKLFLEQYYPTTHKIIAAKISQLFKIFPLAFQKKYAWRLDSLGLDLGIDQAGNIVIFEVNAGPGIGFMAYPVAKAQVRYYEWLKENAVMPCQNFFLPINLRD